jgi:hypothetical protein
MTEPRWTRQNVLGAVVMGAVALLLVALILLVQDVGAQADDLEAAQAGIEEQQDTLAAVESALCEANKPRNGELRQRGITLGVALVAEIQDLQRGQPFPDRGEARERLLSRLELLDLFPVVRCDRLRRVLERNAEHVTAEQLLGHKPRFHHPALGSGLDRAGRGRLRGIESIIPGPLLGLTGPSGSGAGGGSGVGARPGGAGHSPGEEPLLPRNMIPDPLCQLLPEACKASTWPEILLFDG